jgi:hypothetical protein
MNEAHALFCVCSVQPIGCTRQDGRESKDNSEPDELAGSRDTASAACEVEKRGAAPTPDGEVGKQWVKGMTEKRPADDILDAPIAAKEAGEAL